EHVRGPGTFRDERRDPPQRRLLFGKTPEFAGILHVRAPLREWPSTIRSMASAERADFRQDSRLAELGAHPQRKEHDRLAAGRALANLSFQLITRPSARVRRRAGDLVARLREREPASAERAHALAVRLTGLLVSRELVHGMTVVR